MRLHADAQLTELLWEVPTIPVTVSFDSNGYMWMQEWHNLHRLCPNEDSYTDDVGNSWLYQSKIPSGGITYPRYYASEQQFADINRLPFEQWQEIFQQIIQQNKENVSLLLDNISYLYNIWGKLPQGTRNITERITIYTENKQIAESLRKFEGNIISIVHWDIPTDQHKGNIEWTRDGNVLRIKIS